MKKNHTLTFLILGALLLAGLSSCQFLRLPYDIKIIYPQTKVTTNELRVQLNELSTRFPVIIKTVVEEVRVETNNPEIIRRAALFEATATPMIQKATLYNNPLISLGEIWSISLQLLEYFERGDGKGVFGKEQNRVLFACEEMVRESDQVARELLSEEDYEKIKTELESWVDEEGRLKGPLMLRRSTIPLNTAELLGSNAMNTFQALSNINESLDKIAFSIFSLTERMPEYVNWQSRLFMKELYGEGEKIAVKFAIFAAVFFGLIFIVLGTLLVVLIIRTRRLKQLTK